MPVQFPTAFEQGIAKRKVATSVAQVPLTAGEDLKWSITLLEVLDRVSDRFGFVGEFTGLAQKFDDALLRLFDLLAR